MANREEILVSKEFCLQVQLDYNELQALKSLANHANQQFRLLPDGTYLKAEVEMIDRIKAWSIPASSSFDLYYGATDD